MEAFEALAEVTGTLENHYIKDWTKQGKKVLGYVCSYVPEEIFYAADILPYRITGKGVSDTSRADAYMARVNCSFARCVLEAGFTGRFDFLQGAVFMNGCEHIRRAYENWEAHRLVSDEVKSQLGIPSIRLEADGWDSRITPMPIIKEKLSDFFDMVLENK